MLTKNVYLEDRLHAVKIVASQQNINISYENNSQEDKERKRKKRKHLQNVRLSLRGANSSLNETDVQIDQTPPDKKSTVRKMVNKKKKQGHTMVGTRVKVEYEENVAER